MPPFTIPYASRSSGYPSRISDLIRNQGEIQAQRAARSGDIWSGTLRDIAQGIANIPRMQAETEERKARADERTAQADERKARTQQVEQETAASQKAAERAAIEDLGLRDLFSRNPSPQLKDVSSIVGVERGTKILTGVQALNDLPGKQGDEALKRLIPTAAGFSVLSPSMQAQMWPSVREAALGTGLFQPEALPEQFTPELGAEVGKFAQAYQGKEDKPVNLQHVETAQGIRAFDPVRGSLGPVLAPGKPTAAPGLERVETVDAEGKPVTQFVTPKAGQSFAKPTGSGKPATGQQRKALNYFNRAKEAQEIASALEEGNKINPTSLKYTPEIANFLLSDDNQAYQQAQRAFTETRLRKDSGAAIKDEEYENDAKTYFAQQGDSAATRAQKRAGRNAVLAGIAFESGDALKEFYGDEAEGMLSGLKAAQKPGSKLNTGDSYGYPEGTVISGPDGDLVLRGGKWVKP